MANLTLRIPKGSPLTYAEMDANFSALNSQFGRLKLFNFMDYGCVGDGVTDDTTNYQACVTAAIAAKGKLIQPAPPAFYKLTSTINFNPATGNETIVDFEAYGQRRDQVRYSGAAGTACFKINSLRTSTWTGLGISLADSSNGTIAIDADTTGDGSSFSFNQFNNITIVLGSSNTQEAWRIGHVSANGGDISCNRFDTCLVYGNTANRTGFGWHIEGSNTLDNIWVNAFGAFLGKMISNTSGVGATASGNGAMYFYGMGTSQNVIDIDISNMQSYVFVGGRFESGKRVLQVNNSNVSPSITFIGTEINDYDPATAHNGHLMYLDMPCSLSLLNCNIRSGSHAAYTDQMIKLYGGGGGTAIGRLIIEGGVIEASDPCYNRGNDTPWQVYIRGVGKPNNGGVNIAMQSDSSPARLPVARSANASVIDAEQFIFANAASGAFTLTLPASPVPGETHEIKKTDTSFNAVTVAGNGKNIDGQTSWDIEYPGLTMRIKYDGTQWQILNN